jgi:hypothetical protein
MYQSTASRGICIEYRPTRLQCSQRYYKAGEIKNQIEDQKAGSEANYIRQLEGK